MGMAASQARLLDLTSRQNALSTQLTMLAAQKMSLTRESRAISKEYNDALNSKIYKWTNGSTYQTLSYSTLMKPNSITNNKNYLITDLNDRVVLDGNYAKYAEMFSPNGQPGADWGGDTRLEILAELTGVDKDMLEKQESLLKECYAKKDAYLEAENSKPNPNDYKQKQNSLTDLIAIYNKSASSGTSIPTGSNTGICLKTSDTDFLNLKQLGKYLGSEENQKHWEEAIEEIIAEYASFMTAGKEIDDGVFKGPENGKYTPVWDGLSQRLLNAYNKCGGDVVSGSDGAYNGSSLQLVWFNPDDYAEYSKALEEWSNSVNSTSSELEKTNNEYDALFDAETENLIKFYDTMFSAIAENGWVVNYNINDSEYLNNMLQNNQFMITTVERDTEYNEDTREFKYSNEYKTQLASQVSNLAEVNDNDAQTRALAIAEARKEEVEEKEERIDLRMTNLKTEYSANKEIIESIKNVLNKNIESNFNIFS